VVVKGEGGVQDGAKVARLVGGRDSGVVNDEGANFGEDGFGAYVEEFRFSKSNQMYLYSPSYIS
jgi:hypothetical protein